MSIIWKNRIFVAHILALAIVKLAFAYPLVGLYGLATGQPLFSKNDIIVQTNAFRQNLGIAVLRENALLDQAAQDKLADMVAHQYFAHISPTGVDPWHWITTNHYDYSYAGENLAIGFFDAKETVTAWANSPSHRRNMADTRFQEIGVATAPVTIKNSQGIVVIQLFGTPFTKSVVTPPPPIEAITSPVPKKESPLNLVYVEPPLTESPTESNIVITHPPGYQSTTFLNLLFSIYAGIVAIISIFMLIRSTTRHHLWLKTLVHVVIFLVALYLSPIILTRIALIL